jgi:L-ascorbate metabolism protein UlaG (beta-lactamase superfamily)
VYCRSGKRSALAAGGLTKEGYKVVNLKGGIIAWKEAGMPVVTESPIEDDIYEVDSFTTKSGKTVKVHALVHASMRIEYDDREIQIDPVTKLGEKTIDYAAMPKADYLFITHEHHDHFDTTAIQLLTGDNTQLVTNQRCAEMLGYGTVMANGDMLQLADDITLEAVPAYNTTEGHQQFHPKGRDNGFILTLDGLRIYIAGDTEDIPEMAEIKDIDVAFMPCNQPYTMTVEQLVNAARIVKPKVLFPYHYGQTDVSGISSQLENDGVEVRIRHYE